MKAYPLPYNIFDDDSSDFVKQLFTLLEYTKPIIMIILKLKLIYS